MNIIPIVELLHKIGSYFYSQPELIKFLATMNICLLALQASKNVELELHFHRKRNRARFTETRIAKPVPLIGQVKDIQTVN